MDFSWTEEQSELYAATVKFAQAHLSRQRKQGHPGSEGGHSVPDEAWFRERWKRCGQQGVLAGLLHEDYGGVQMDALTSALLMQALGYGCDDFGFVFSLAAHVYACTVPLQQFGSEELKARYLRKMGAGDLIATHSITEPDAGSDPFAMKATARRDGDHYILNGTKCYASNAPFSDLLLIHAKTDEKAGFMSVSAFVVERSWPGVSVSQPHAKSGLDGSPIGDVFLEDCRVPVGNRLGEEGNGGVIFSHSMNWERTCLFAAYLGSMERELELCVEYASSRRQGGRRIGDYQAVAHRIADMKVRLEAARWLIYKGAWGLDNGASQVMSADASIAKLFISEAAVASALDAIQVHGGAGVMVDSGIERYLRDAVPSRIFSGTAEAQRNTIARLLGLKSGC